MSELNDIDLKENNLVKQTKYIDQADDLSQHEQLNKNKINSTELKKYLAANSISNDYFSHSLKPITITLPEGDFTINKCLRILPNRRIVFQAVNSIEKPVLIKIFINEKKYIKDYNLILNGYKLLQNAKLLTPTIISSKLDEINKLSYIIYEVIESIESIESTAQQSKPDNHHKHYIAAIAKLHKNHLYQEDLHLNNFILNNKKMYYLDTSSLYLKNNFLVNKQASKNFALFLAQLDLAYYHAWPMYIKYYLQCLVTNISNNTVTLIKYIDKQANKKLNQKITRFLLKTQRDCSDFKVVKAKNVWGVANRKNYNVNMSFFDKFLTDPQKFITQYNIKTLKQGSKSHVYLINYNNQNLVIKYYLPGSFINQIAKTVKSFFIRPRCLNSWRNSNLLRHMNIATPHPIACFIFKKYFLMNQSFFIMDYSEDYKTFADIIGDNPQNDFDVKNINWDNLADSLINLLNNFKIMRILHQDLKTVNLGLDNNQLKVIDLDAMRIFKSDLISRLIYNYLADKDINRLLRCFKNNQEFSMLLKNKALQANLIKDV